MCKSVSGAVAVVCVVDLGAKKSLDAPPHWPQQSVHVPGRGKATNLDFIPIWATVMILSGRFKTWSHSAAYWQLGTAALPGTGSNSTGRARHRHVGCGWARKKSGGPRSASGRRGGPPGLWPGRFNGVVSGCAMMPARPVDHVLEAIVRAVAAQRGALG